MRRRATVAVLALGLSCAGVSTLAVAGEAGRSYDVAEFEPAGVPVEGSPDEVYGPLLTPGQYVDTFPVGDDPLFYHVRRTMPGSTIHAGVSARSIGGGTASVHVTLAVDETSNVCGQSVGLMSTKFGLRELGSTAAHTWKPDPDHECNTADEVIVQVNQGGSELGNVPFELVVYEEPPLESTDGLPPAEDDVTWERMEPADTAESVVPGTGPSNAPVVEPGTYQGKLSVGEAHFYAIPLDWGQRLQAEIHTGPLQPQRVDDSAVDVRIFGPVRESINSRLDVEDTPTWPRAFNDVDDGGSFRTGAITPTVSFLNRNDMATAPGALPGYRYVEVQLYGDHEGPVPYTLTLQTYGKAGEGAPEYAGPDGGQSAEVPATSELIKSAEVDTDPPDPASEEPSGTADADSSSPASRPDGDGPSTSPVSGSDTESDNASAAESAADDAGTPTLPLLLGGLGMIFAAGGGVMFAKVIRRYGLIR